MRKIKRTVDEHSQAAGQTGDPFQVIDAGLFDSAFIFFKDHRAEAVNRTQWSAQVVGHRVDECFDFPVGMSKCGGPLCDAVLQFGIETPQFVIRKLARRDVREYRAF